MNFKNLKLKHKLLLQFSLITFIILSVLVIISAFYIRSVKQNETYAIINQQIETATNEILSKIQHNISLMNALNQTIAPVKSPELNFQFTRDYANLVLYEYIRNNPQIYDIYMVWEPNLFDGKDLEYILTEGHDTTGRFIPHLKKDIDGSITYSKVENYFIPSKAQFYFLTKSNLKLNILEPYMFRTKAQNIHKLPIAAPIMFGNKFLGVSAFEININNLQLIIDKINADNSNQLCIITSKGQIIAVSNSPLYRGKFIDKLFPEEADNMYLKFRKGESFITNYKSKKIINKKIHLTGTDNYWNICIIANQSEMAFPYQKAILVTISIALLIFLIAIYTFYTFLAKYSQSIDEVLNQWKKVIYSFIKPGKINTNQVAEFKTFENEIHHAYSILDSLKKIFQAFQIKEFNTGLDTLEKDNEFQKTVNDTIKILNEQNIQDKQRTETENKLAWIRQGVAQLNEAMRIGSGDFNDMLSSILKSLTNYTNANLGGLYIINDTQEVPYLELVTAFAYDHKKAMHAKVDIGIGLVGTCAAEKQAIFLTKIPDNYINLSSGLGNSAPRSLLLVPLIYDNKLVGVIEIGFLKVLENFEKEFIESIADTIASTITTAKINAQTITLLNQTKKQAEILSLNEQQMSANIEQLKETQKQILEREADLKGLVDAVNNTILTIEYTTKGILLTANDKYLKTMNYHIDELKGVNVLNLVKTERAELENILHRVSQGEFIQKLVKRFTKSGEIRWLLSTYTPFFNIEGKITKVLYFAYDVTETKNHTELLENEIIELKDRILKLESEITNNK